MSEEHPQIPAVVLSRLDPIIDRKYLKIGLPWLGRSSIITSRAFPQVKELGQLLRRNVPRNKSAPEQGDLMSCRHQNS